MWKCFEMWKNKKIKRDIREINYEDVEKGEYLIIDVRSKKEFLEGHINGSINIPLYDLENHIQKLPDKHCPIIIYCRSGHRSKQAKEKLERLGYENIYNLKNGLDGM